jgi:hypothetical protein
MRSSSAVSGWLFRMAVAVAAAALANPLIEWLSDTGIFGPGRFTDRSNLDVIPALTVAFALGMLFVLVLARRMFSPSSYPPQWLRRYAGEIGPASVRRMLPSIFVLQLISLFGMETLEQIATAGHPLGGSIWLGGPAAVSLAGHFLSCIVFAWALYHGLHWSARTIVRAVRIALEILRRILQPPALPQNGINVSVRPKFIEPYLRALQGRAPPQSCRI